MMEFYLTGKVGCAMIAADDVRSLKLAKKHRLVRANTCGSRIRHVGSIARFERFRKEINV